MEVMQILALSTAHLTEETCNVFLPSNQIVSYEKARYGHFLPIPDAASLEGREIPEDLKAVIDFARAKSFDWLMFDCDVDPIDELPTFEWDGNIPNPTIRKATVTVTFLYDTKICDPAIVDRMSLDRIDSEIDCGEFVGAITQRTSNIVPHDQVQAELFALGNDGSFFG